MSMSEDEARLLRLVWKHLQGEERLWYQIGSATPRRVHSISSGSIGHGCVILYINGKYEPLIECELRDFSIVSPVISKT